MLNEEEIVGGLAYEEDEADGFDEFDGFDEGDGYEAADGFDAMDEADGFDAGDEFDEDGFDEDGFDAMDAYGGFDEEGEESEDGFDAFDAIVANALSAEEADEFFGGLLKGLRRVAGTVGSGLKTAGKFAGKAGRFAAPILSAIPIPQAQAAGKIAELVGGLMADGASEEEAFDAMAEYAVRDRRALPILAGLAVRQVTRGAGSHMPAEQRRAVVRQVRRATQQLVGRQGPRAIRSLSPVVRSVVRTAAVRGTPARARPKVLIRTLRRVASSPRMAQRLSRPLHRGRQALVRAGRSGFGFGTTRGHVQGWGHAPGRGGGGGPYGYGYGDGSGYDPSYGGGHGGHARWRNGRRRIRIPGPAIITVRLV